MLDNAGSGRNCAVVMKRAWVGTPTYTGVSIKKRGRFAPWVVDDGMFRYYAGPVYRHARGQCVRFEASVDFPNGMKSLWISRFGHCR